MERLSAQQSSHDGVAGQKKLSVVIASTFTAEPLRQPLKFWAGALDIPADITVAPYAQLMQELLNPESLSARNKAGYNILLIRPEDWIRDQLSDSAEQSHAHLRRCANELAAALETHRGITAASLLLYFCPSSETLPLSHRRALEQIQDDLIIGVQKLANVHCFTHWDLVRSYPVSEYEDRRADRLGHIPYTDEYFAALATLLARRLAMLLKPPYKVIAVDCDDTLWKGICGEVGAAGIELTPAHLKFQTMLVRQHDAGVLLCLCSKNNPADVEEVFTAHPEMRLRKEHLVSSRVNWQAKSTNLQSLSDELGLSLESFIFIDDNALECAEVQASHPDVLSLQFPQDSQDIEHFVDHVWAFDRIGPTEDAKRRTDLYKLNRARDTALQEAGGLEAFLASLDLKVDVSPMARSHLARVAELVQRTNQFNLTSIRRQVGEIETLWSSGALQSLVVHVRDRFGDHGLVGAILYRRLQKTTEVDTFVLSCRVLGRGVEHHIVNALGRQAKEEECSHIALRYRRTPRNQPALDFLESSFAQLQAHSGALAELPAEGVLTFPAEFAERLRRRAATASIGKEELTPARFQSKPKPANCTEWHTAAYRLSRLPDLLQALKGSRPQRQRRHREYVVPGTPTEAAVAAIWAEVLGLEQISARDDFFELGGDSLQAVRAISRMGSVLGLELPLREFFESPTVEQVAAQLANALPASAPIPRADLTDSAPLSSAQLRLWFIDQLERGSAAYHISEAMRMQGDLNGSALQKALDTLVVRHESLRTVFIKQGGAPLQQITPAVPFALQMVNLRSVATARREAEVARQIQEDASAPFNLSAGPLIRGRLLELSPDEHVLVITMHHIISDGWSIGILIRELRAFYSAYRDGLSDPLPPLPIRYIDYAVWQRGWLNETQAREQLDYWRAQLRGATERLDLPTDRARPPAQSYRGNVVGVALGYRLTEELKTLARDFNVTLAMTLYTAWAILLWRLSGETDIVVGMPVANRRRTALEGLIGFFVNTLAVRVHLENEVEISTLLKHVKESMLGAFAHQDVPFDQVVDALQPVRNLSHAALFQVMFVLQNAPRDPLQLSGLALLAQEVPSTTAQYDLTLSLCESPAGLIGSINYASDLFDAETIERWACILKTVLTAMVQAPGLKIGRVALTDEKDRRQIIESFNATQLPYSTDKLIHELFEEQVERTPDAIAVLHEQQSLTYRELNGRANQLARYLRKSGVGCDQLVGICVERSFESVVGLFGILKAGGAYVPLDPSYPAERIAYMLEDAAPRVLLIQERLKVSLPHSAADIIALDADWSAIAQQLSSNLDLRAEDLCSRHLAYVIYTSGSTGKPKGAMNEHRALINRLQWMQEQYQLSDQDRVLQKTPFSFDVSVWEFFWTLMTGARLVIARPQGHQDPAYLTRLIETTGVTTLHFVPSMLQVFLDQHRAGECPSLRHVVCSGEELPASLQRKFFVHLPHAQLHNLYGPTEAAIDVTAWECKPHDDSARVPIGAPISNIQMYVLDHALQPLPIGVAGEIYIGGVGVGRGYLNRPELTAERFIPDPIGADLQARLYKTGDLGRWRADGAIEYLGRNDHQVKIRGFRIELGEIEAQLLRRPQVKEAVVIARQDSPGEKRLVAYVTTCEPNVLSIEELRAHLKAVLPEYMVPSAFVMLERMPLTPNGKLDRRALPAPRLEAYVRHRYEAPQGEVEEILAGIWQSLLGMERVGRQDNFFELGGHSLLIVQMMERLRRVGLVAEVRRVFESPTLADLAAALLREVAQPFEVPPNLIPLDCESITPQMLPLVELEMQHIERIVQSVSGGTRNIQDIYPLTALQEGILFHHLLDEQGADIYVVPILLSVSSRETLEQLKAAFQGVIDRHDVLRTAILWEQLPRPVQVVYRRAMLPVEEITLDRARDSAEQIKEWMRLERQRMDLRQAPLLRLQIAADPHSAQWYVVVQTHHLTLDHVSLETVLSEIGAHLEGQTLELPASAPYRNHVAQTLAHARTHDAEAFFRSKLAGIDEPTVPFGLLDVRGDGSHIAEAYEKLESELTQRIRVQARRLGVSVATLFHAAWALVVARTSGRDDVVFGTVLLGRLESAGAQGVLGVFMNTLPLRLRLRNVSSRELVEQTQRALAELLSHEQASLATARRCSEIRGAAPVFSALLNYRHSIPGQEMDWANRGGMRILAAYERTNYPVTLSIDDFGEQLALKAQTALRIDPSHLTQYVLTAIHSLVHALEHALRTPALQLAVLPESERLKVIESFNATQLPYSTDKLIHELFEEQVERTPDAVAVVYDGQSLTYAELNKRANRVGRLLRQKGVGLNQLVAICVERSAELVVGLLAVLKAGGAYVPLDMKYPAARLQYMLTDTAPRVVLTQEHIRGHLPQTVAEVMTIEEALSQQLEVENLAVQDGELRSERAAYVMYTSGSTGAPKGVVVPHRAISRLVIDNGYAQIEATDCIAHSSNPAFDASTFEIWGALLNGASVLVVPQSVVFEGSRFAQMLKEHHVTVLWLTAGLFSQYTEVLAEVFSSLRYLLVGGDVVEPRMMSRVLSASAPQNLLNAYGPTECTTFSTTYRIESVAEKTDRIPIGRPISNTKTYILDAQGEPVPIEVTGELYIGGAGVALGYLNRPELTAERFLRDPFRADPQARMYRTGDLARWRADGNIEFVGRNDQQVKIRGFRIEPGEIEAQLLLHGQAREAVVLAREDVSGEKSLVAYLTARDANGVSVEALRSGLKAVLPEYMVPSAFVVLESMPLTPNGKLDRQALPAPDLRAYVSPGYEAPQGQVEEILASIWQDLLRVEQIGRHDNFFELGGHSLQGMRLVVRVAQRLKANLSVATIFQYPTIQHMAAIVESQRMSAGEVPHRDEVEFDEEVIWAS